MRFALDYTPALTQGAGIGRYARSLVSALARVDQSDTIVLFSHEAPQSGREFPRASNIQVRMVPVRRLPIFWHRLHMPLPIELLTGPIDVFHGTDSTIPPARRARRVVTVHDRSFMIHPECAVPSLAAYLNRVVPRAVRTADHVIADSHQTANDLVERLGVPRERITPIHLGIEPDYHRLQDTAYLADLSVRYGLRHPLVLAVGTIEPRKNYARLIEAFAEARRMPGGPAMLVIAGRKGWLYDDVFAAVERHSVSDGVRFAQYVSEADLRGLYCAADMLAMPSIYEGFGLPAVEAMALGTPVICSNGGSLPEVVGDAALIVPPEDVSGLAEALAQVARDPQLRQDLIACGLARSGMFTWEGAAQAHLAVYRNLTPGAGGASV